MGLKSAEEHILGILSSISMGFVGLRAERVSNSEMDMSEIDDFGAHNSPGGGSVKLLWVKQNESNLNRKAFSWLEVAVDDSKLMVVV